MMSTCPSCAREVPIASSFCPACGAAVGVGVSDLTVTADAPEVVPAAGSPASTSSAPKGIAGRFIPGTVLAGRYRIFGLLGRGGMGEVYRADDLKLGQPVALKFLPEELCTEATLARFYNEVRVARQVSHPNVCRVYDILEVDGKHFLSMEFIDGEDLASLLRRIGRLPKDKALDIVRQLCAGLAAAHDRGVLHRDLKPANIMIDGRGQVRITDFGLAGLAKEIVGKEIRAGTPAYMSPEQITGKEVSVRSDIYALGLVLYETFTGQRTFKADTIAQISQMHQSATPTHPSQILDDFDPAIERVILRCLEKDPDKRPQSALSVAAMLPGGDPLAAALAAGETPSPEMVAAAGASGVMKPATAVFCLLCVVFGLVAVTLLSERVSLIGRIPLEKQPVVLEDRARQVLADLGYDQPPADSAHWLGRDTRYLKYIEKSETSANRWDALSVGQPGVVVFIYRQSPVPLRPINAGAIVWPYDPAPLTPGMVNLTLDGRGRLTELRAVAEHAELSNAAAPSADWPTVFSAAGLELSRFASVEPDFTPPTHADNVLAWRGVYPDNPELSLRVEAAAYRGKCVYFHEIGPWAEASGKAPTYRARSFNPAEATTFTLQIVVLFGSVVLARRNQRLGRGDRRGAWRLAVCLFVTNALSWLLTVHHSSSLSGEWRLIQSAAGITLWAACFPWCLYMAVEPFVRRLWPETLISWARLLAGRIADPLVGRDILLGCTLAVVVTLGHYVQYCTAALLGLPPPRPMSSSFNALANVGSYVNHFLIVLPESVYLPMIFLLVILLLRVVLRSQRAAIAVFFVLLVSLYPVPVTTGNLAVDLVFRAALAITTTVLLLRCGVFVLMVQMFFVTVLVSLPLTFDFSVWYSWVSIATMTLFVVVAACGFCISLGGRQFLLSGQTRTHEALA